MPIPVVCPACRAKMICPDAELGRRKECPECGDPFTVRSVNDTPPEGPPADTRPLHPGWRRVARGYRMLEFALVVLLFGVLATAGVTVGAWALYGQQVWRDDAVPRAIGWVVGGAFGAAVFVLSVLGHLFLMAMPAAEDGGKGRTLAAVMFALALFPGPNVLVPLLLPVYSAGVGTALGSRRLTQTGWLLYTWYAAGAFAVPMLAQGCIAGGMAVGSPPLGFIAGGLVALVGWSLTAVAVYRAFDGLRCGIADAVAERGVRG